MFLERELGEETSVVTNYDWYSPSNARRYSENEIQQLTRIIQWKQYFHKEVVVTAVGLLNFLLTIKGKDNDRWGHWRIFKKLKKFGRFL